MSFLVQICKGGSFYSDFKLFLRTMSRFVPLCQSTRPYNDNACRNGIFCQISIWSTPKNPQNHARDLKKHVDGCIKAKENNETDGENDA